MDLTEFLAKNQVFTTQALLKATDGSPSIPVALSRAVKSGKVEKARTGLYISQSGKFQGVEADPHLIAAVFRPDAVFAYHSALTLHGLAHSVFNHVQFMTSQRPSAFSYSGSVFEGVSFRPNAQTAALHARAYGTVTVTTREQTLVDCMAKIRMAGGAEEVVRSFAGLPYADTDTIFLCLGQYPSSVASRIGWYLEANQERWAVSSEILSAIESRVSQKASYKLDPAAKRFEAYNARWHLSLPATEATIRTWMEL